MKKSPIHISVNGIPLLGGILLNMHISINPYSETSRTSQHYGIRRITDPLDQFHIGWILEVTHREFISPAHIVQSLRILSCGFHFMDFKFGFHFRFFFSMKCFFIFFMFSFFATLCQISFDTIYPCPKGASQILFYVFHLKYDFSFRF